MSSTRPLSHASLLRILFFFWWYIMCILTFCKNSPWYFLCFETLIAFWKKNRAVWYMNICSSCLMFGVWATSHLSVVCHVVSNFRACVYYVNTCILSECYKAFEPHVTCLRKRPRERERKRKRERAHHTLQHTLQHTLHHTLQHTLQHTTKHFSHTSHVCSPSGNVSSIVSIKETY